VRAKVDSQIDYVLNLLEKFSVWQDRMLVVLVANHQKDNDWFLGCGQQPVHFHLWV
jgi:hypothetical protein